MKGGKFLNFKSHQVFMKKIIQGKKKKRSQDIIFPNIANSFQKGNQKNLHGQGTDSQKTLHGQGTDSQRDPTIIEFQPYYRRSDK